MVKAVCVVVGDAKGNVYFEQVSSVIQAHQNIEYLNRLVLHVCFFHYLYMYVNGEFNCRFICLNTIEGQFEHASDLRFFHQIFNYNFYK